MQKRILDAQVFSHLSANKWHICDWHNEICQTYAQYDLLYADIGFCCNNNNDNNILFTEDNILSTYKAQNYNFSPDAFLFSESSLFFEGNFFEN